MNELRMRLKRILLRVEVEKFEKTKGIYVFQPPCDLDYIETYFIIMREK